MLFVAVDSARVRRRGSMLCEHSVRTKQRDMKMIELFTLLDGHSTGRVDASRD